MALSVPIDILNYSALVPLVKPTHIRTFLYIKALSPDRFILNKDFYNSFSRKSGICIKTAQSHVKLLIQQNWLGHNKINNRIFVRSYRTIKKLIRGKSKYYLSTSISNLSNINELVLTAAVAYQSKIYSYKKIKPELPNGGSLQGVVRKGKIMRGYAPIAVTLLGKLIGKSTSFTDRIKKGAIEKGYITRVKDYNDTNVIWAERFAYFVGYPGFYGRARKIEGKLCIVGIDLLKANLLLKKKKG